VIEAAFSACLAWHLPDNAIDEWHGHLRARSGQKATHSCIDKQLNTSIQFCTTSADLLRNKVVCISQKRYELQWILTGASNALTQQCHFELEGHSVERMYLRQSCSDGSRWIKPLKSHASLQPNTYRWDFPDVIKFREIRYRRKQSGSGIRTIIRIGLKSSSVRPCPDICRHATFHPNPCTPFWVILLTDRQTDRQTNEHGQKHTPSPLSEVWHWVA